MRPALCETARITHTELAGTDWVRMGAMKITP